MVVAKTARKPTVVQFLVDHRSAKECPARKPLESNLRSYVSLRHAGVVPVAVNGEEGEIEVREIFADDGINGTIPGCCRPSSGVAELFAALPNVAASLFFGGTADVNQDRRGPRQHIIRVDVTDSQVMRDLRLGVAADRRDLDVRACGRVGDPEGVGVATTSTGKPLTVGAIGQKTTGRLPNRRYQPRAGRSHATTQPPADTDPQPGSPLSASSPRMLARPHPQVRAFDRWVCPVGLTCGFVTPSITAPIRRDRPLPRHPTDTASPVAVGPVRRDNTKRSAQHGRGRGSRPHDGRSEEP